MNITSHMNKYGVVGPIPINQWSDRGALGLPEHYVPSQLTGARECFNQLRYCSTALLARIVESMDHSTAGRYAAGQILSQIGDPRIDTLQPAMVEIPENSVTIGLNETDVDHVLQSFGDTGVLRQWIEKEVPAHTRKLNAFRIGKYPVTNGEFAEFLKATNYPEIPTSWSFGFNAREFENHPVYSISAEAADAYAMWLSKITGRKFRLPRESEWEYAATGGGGREFPWGDQFSSACCNTIEAGIGSTTPVGMFAMGASPFGVLDMAGNVEEYVMDDYHPYPGGEFINDDLTVQGQTYRVARGGSFTRFRDLARCKRRHGRYPRSIYVMGFRLAEDL